MSPEPSYADVQSAALDQAVRAAVTSGDMTEVRQLLAHMAAEGPDGITWDWLLAVVLFKLRMEAEHQGRPVLAAQYERMAAAECSPQAIRLVGLDSLLILGRRRGGWLHAEEYDHAAALAAAEFPQLLPKLRELERRER